MPSADSPGAGLEVVFVGGSGRNGSTLLDRLLGQVPGLHSGGEVRFAWRRGLPTGQPCGCGREVGTCPFWAAVAARFPEGLEPALEAAKARSRRIERNRNLPLLVAPALRPAAFRRDLAGYGAFLDRFYRALLGASGSTAVVDSSKDPLYALTLAAALPAARLSVVHLVRDSRAVAHSWQRHRQQPAEDGGQRSMPRYPPVRSALEWDRANLLLHVAGRRCRNYVRLRYEDLVGRPAATLGSLLAAVGRDAGDLGFLDGSTAVLAPAHAVWGNPMRLSRGPVTLRLDDEWRRAMPAASRALVGAVTLPLLAAYRYL